MAPHTKLTEATKKQIYDLVRIGVAVETAAWKAGVSDQTVFSWIRRGRVETTGPYYEFYEGYKAALADSEITAMARVREATVKQWRAATWILERRFPERYAQQVNITVQERDAIADELVSRLREKLDAETFRRVAAVFSDEVLPESDPGIIEH